MESSGREQVYFDRDGILVTTHRIVIRDATIPVRAIASVDVNQLKQSHKGPMILYAVSLLPLCAGHWLVMLVIAGAGVAWQFNQMKKPMFALAIRTADGNGKELTGPDGHLFGEVAAAINEAIASN